MSVHIGRTWVHTVNYRKERGGEGGIVNRGFWVQAIPRPLILCRLFGHRPVVDGTGPDAGTADAYRGPGHRWVTCDRCGVRPEPQGVLDPDLVIGQPYTGGYSGRFVLPDGPGKAQTVGTEPGPWPKSPTWVFGGQLVVGAGCSPGVEVKVGNAGSEHTLAANVTLGRVGALYVHTEQLGTWLQRRLNPTGYDSRVVGLSVMDGRLHWDVWARRDHHSSTDPKWMSGSVVVDPRDRIAGPKRYSYTDWGAPVGAVLRLPHGDDHPVTMQLRREHFGRERGKKRLSWSVGIDSPDGIPTETGNHGRIMGFSVAVPHRSVNDGTWPVEASAAAATRITADRGRGGWKPTAESAAEQA